MTITRSRLLSGSGTASAMWRMSRGTLRTVLEETRAALEAADVRGPFVLVPQVPMLFFTSNGEGTALDAEPWRQQQTDFLANVDVSKQVFLGSGHYVHDHDHAEIAAKSKQFLRTLGTGANS